MREQPLASVITAVPGSPPKVSHLPLLAELRPESRGDGKLFLVGHLSRGNPQWKDFESVEPLAVFHGPQAYITPRWYPDPLNVPTWNYAVVHASGPAKLIQDAEGIEAILLKSVEEFEKNEPQPWRMQLPREFQEDLVRAIIGVEIEVTRLEGKFKLSQNRESTDRQGVLAGLATRKDEMSLRLRELMIGASKR